MLVAEPFSGASQTALNFICDQQRAMLLRQPVSRFGKLTAHRPDATFSLYELETNRTDGVVKIPLEVCDVIEFHELHTGKDRREGCTILFLVRGRQRAEGASVEGVFEGEDSPLRLF